MAFQDGEPTLYIVDIFVDISMRSDVNCVLAGCCQVGKG